MVAPWCGHCKNLQPHWNAAASRLKGKVRLGKVDATAEKRLAQTYGIQSFPTLKVFPAGQPLDKPLDYEGGRTTDTIEAAALELLRKYPPKKEAIQLTSQTVLNDHCVSKGGICVIAILPHILDSKADGRKKYIEVLEEAAKKNPVYPYYYFWSQAYDHKEFEKYLNLGFGYPAVVVISQSKLKYSIMRRAYTVDSVASFLADLMRGFERLTDYKELPPLRNIEKWDGQDPPANPDL
jgi:protein disulfide-isomerase A6